MSFAEALLLSVVTAAMPLMLAALGEMVAERSGVLNLGVEGMMVMGAVSAFGVAAATGSATLGVLAGVGAGIAMAALFGLIALGLAANQVATGLALTIFGLGLSGLIGAPLVGARREPLPRLEIPWLSDIPLVGKMLFGQDALVYLGALLLALLVYVIRRTRTGLVLRAVGDNPEAGHALGIKVLRVRLLAVLFGGAMAGLAGAHLVLAYTPFWSTGMTAGRGWIALALVVFGAWQPMRVAFGALLFGAVTILQFHAQGLGIGLPSQLMASLPYLATIVALVMIAAAGRKSSAAPAALGREFVLDR